ncbi:DUF5684 domain-containing protein [Stomatohabitans albus]|uniref:DUF5684 domain-containing protein n=1 Tax=Stomatohabitans albus TaxID=3110766 RepID=UPI00300CEAE4
MDSGSELQNTVDSLFNQIVSILAGLLVVFAVIAVIVYVISCIPKGKLFQRAGYPAWQGWIPFVNTYVQAKITGRNPWLVLGLSIGLSILNFIPVIGGATWLLPSLLVMWMAYDLALVYSQGKRFSLIYAILAGSAVGASGGSSIVTLPFKMVTGGLRQEVPDLIGIFFNSGVLPILSLVTLIMTYIIAFGSGTRYEGPYSHRNERMLMHDPWLFIPGPNQSIPVPPPLSGIGYGSIPRRYEPTVPAHPNTDIGRSDSVSSVKPDATHLDDVSASHEE